MVKRFLILFVFSFIIQFAFANKSEIKVILKTVNQFGGLGKSLAFIYNGDSLIETAYTNNKGILVLKLEKESEYLLVISHPGHLTSKITLNTEKMYADQVSKIFLDCNLFNVREKNVDLAKTEFKVKWNPITERFEYFTQNFGWIEEIKEKDGIID